MRRVFLALTIVLVGCDAPTTLEGGGILAAAEAVLEAQSGAALEVPEEKVEGRPTTRGEADAAVPEGYVRVEATTRSGAFGHAVILLDRKDERMVPIFIGGTEALSIQLRIEGDKYTRPLTHDLLDTMLGELGVKMVRAQVDDLKDGIYLGTVVVRRGDEIITFDARPSDAIALALGNRAPIFVAERVLAAAEEERAAPKHNRPDPIAL